MGFLLGAVLMAGAAYALYTQQEEALPPPPSHPPAQQAQGPVQPKSPLPDGEAIALRLDTAFEKIPQR
jgi:hypothetical protein